jgi:hypothetical protein
MGMACSRKPHRLATARASHVLIVLTHWNVPDYTKPGPRGAELPRRSVLYSDCRKNMRTSFRFASRAHWKHSSAIARYSAAVFVRRQVVLFSCGIRRQFLKPVCLRSDSRKQLKVHPHCREGRSPLSGHRAAESSLAAALLVMFRFVARNNVWNRKLRKIRRVF